MLHANKYFCIDDRSWKELGFYLLQDLYSLEVLLEENATCCPFLEPYMVHRWNKLGWEMGQQIWWKPSWKKSQVDEKRRWGRIAAAAFWVRGIHQDLQHLWLRFISSQGLRIHHLGSGIVSKTNVAKNGLPVLMWLTVVRTNLTWKGDYTLDLGKKADSPIYCDRLIDLCMTEDGKHM